MSNTAASLKYRPDIDGLRAVAVLGVIIYHAFPWMLPGGFVGVDIFFVISGYLISGILYKGHRSNKFSFKEFYARRIRRLFPSLITVLLLCLGYGWVVLLPDEFQRLGKHVAAGTLFIQNIVFWKESGYFDTLANLKPLLHLWSLAVEEQFYILFPPILLLIWKRKWRLVPVLLLLLLLSMAANLWMTRRDGPTDFFLTPFRAWEFLGGCLLAWWHYEKGHEQDKPFYREAISWAGGLIIILSYVIIHQSSSYPGWRATFPVVGSLLLIEGGRSASVNRWILSNPVVVWIGLISYPLYLFHWPALSFLHIVMGDNPGVMSTLSAIGVSLVLTIITFYFIEKKVRHNSSSWTIPVLVGAFMASGLAGLLIAGGYIHPSASETSSRIATALKDREWTRGMSLLWKDKTMEMWHCGGEGNQTLFFGDSNAMQYTPRISKLLSDNKGTDRGALFYTCGGVPPIINVVVPNKEYECGIFPNKIDHLINENPNIDRVVIAALWPFYFDRSSYVSYKKSPMAEIKVREAAISQLGELIKNLVLKGKKVTVVLSVPHGPKVDPRSWVKRSFYGVKEIRSKDKLASSVFLENYGDLIKSIARVSEENGAEIIDPMASLTKDGYCIGENDEGTIRSDATHLRSGFVREHISYLDSTVQP